MPVIEWVQLIHWHWHTIKQLTAASLFRVLFLWTWPFWASKIFIIVFRVQAAVKLSQLEGNLSNSLDFLFIQYLLTGNLCFISCTILCRFSSNPFSSFCIRCGYPSAFTQCPIRPISTLPSLNWFLQVLTHSLSFSTRFLRLFLHPVLLTKVVILTSDTPDSDEWPQRYGIQQHPFTVTSLNRTPLVFCIVSFCG
jgi:hypothetical protein